jgi:surfeit locus 1 family protein
MHFRPALAPTIATALMLPVLIGLGVWQVERLHWKENLLSALDRNMHTAPVPLANAPKTQSLETQYTRVTARGRFDNAHEAYLFGSDIAGNAGYHIITPFMTDGGATWLVDRGYVPREMRDPSTRAQGQIVGETTVTGLLRWSEQPGLFTPAADIAHRVFYARDANAIAKANNIALAEPAIIDADATPNPGGWPRGGQTIIDIPNNHLSYAFTWFGLAVVLMGVYLAYHVGQGRLGFRR